MSLLAHFEPLPESGRERRRSPRRELVLGTKLGLCYSEVVIHDLSSEGLLLETSADLQVGEMIEVDLPLSGPTHAVVVWRKGHRFGCEFTHAIRSAVVSAALLRGNIVPPKSTTGDQPSSPPEFRRLRTWLIATLAVGGISYLVLTVAVPVIVVAGVLGALGLLLFLLVLWGNWILDNTL